MIKKLKLINFKSHVKSDVIFRNLTVLTGINGYGKSSVIQALLLLRQSFLKNRLMEGLDLNAPLVNLGNTNDILSRYSKDTPIMGFDIDCGDEHFNFEYDCERYLTESFLPLRQYSQNITSEKLSLVSLFNNSFQYVSALRTGGQSLFGQDSYMVEKMHQLSSTEGRCDLLGHFLYKYGNESCYNYVDKSIDCTLLEQINVWESRISMNTQVHVEPNSSDKKNYRILYDVIDAQGRAIAAGLSASNVGYGLSYTLPVIVALLAAVSGDLVIVENPEAHLHPAGQVALGELITLVASRGVQVVIETHSDHIINSILLSCKAATEGGDGLSAEDVALSYMGKMTTEQGTEVQSVKISGGKLEYQPKGFVDQYEHDVYLLNR